MFTCWTPSHAAALVVSPVTQHTQLEQTIDDESDFSNFGTKALQSIQLCIWPFNLKFYRDEKSILMFNNSMAR